MNKFLYGFATAASLMLLSLSLSAQQISTSYQEGKWKILTEASITGEGISVKTSRIRKKTVKPLPEMSFYLTDEACSDCVFLDDTLRQVFINGVRLYTFDCLISYPDGKYEIASAIFDPIGVDLETRSVPCRKEGEQYVGYYSDAMVAVPTEEGDYLTSHLSEISILRLQTEGEYLTENILEWWKSNNPENAAGRSVKLKFCTIPSESTLYEQYSKARKEKSPKFSVAMFDALGYTFIMSRSVSSGNLSLVWMEPECKDHNTDRLLNSVWFEDDSTLVMFYYHGRKTYKYRLNLATHTLAR